MKAAGCVQKICSVQYLHVLYMELCRARSFTLSSIPSSQSLLYQSQRLDFLRHELNRLLNYPKLFPSPEVQARFMIIAFRLDTEHRFFSCCASLMIGRENSHIPTKSSQQMCEASKLSERYGWDRFLLSSAAENLVLRQEKETDGCFQLLPAIGMRICTDLACEQHLISGHKQEVVDTQRGLKLPSPSEVNVSDKCLKIRTGHTQRSTSQHIARDTVASKYTQMLERHHEITSQHRLEDIILQPSPFRSYHAPRIDIMHHQSKTIEMFSQIIYRLETLGPRHTAPPTALNAPNSFPLLSVWRNSKARDLGRCSHACCLNFNRDPGLHLPIPV